MPPPTLLISRAVVTTVALAFLLASCASAKSTASTPYRGWSSWSLSAITNSNVYGRAWLNESNVLAQSDALAASPLQRSWPAPYINIDSFWAMDPTAVDGVDAYGRWTHDVGRFPNGMKAVGDHVHANGQKYGLYLNPGVAVAAVKAKSPIANQTGCTAADIAWQPLTRGNTFGDTYRVNFSHRCAAPYFVSFAQLLASWGVDFLKLDAVSPGSNDNDIDNREDVTVWSDALASTGRDIWLTISWHINATYAPDFAPHTNAWRTSDDVDCYCPTLTSWNSAVKRFVEVVPFLPWSAASGGGVFPDLDSLNVMQGPTLDGLTDDEACTSVTLWSITLSPLYTGNDLTVADASGLMLLTHGEVLAINEGGVSAAPAQRTQGALQQVWTVQYGNGTKIAALFNLGAAAANVTLELGTAVYGARDVWLRQDVGVLTGDYVALLEPHACRLLRLTPA